VIDFHCHIDLYPDPAAVAAECARRAIYVLSVTTTPSAWRGTSRLASNASRIRTALGLHPQIAHQRKGELPLFDELLPSTRYVGEVGLDGDPEFRLHHEDQLRVFRYVLAACRAAGGRVITIHSRRATGAVLDEIEAHSGFGTPILHWFSGTPKELRRAVALGCWFSVGPVMLATEKGRSLATEMPRERILTETDGPFARVNDRPLFPWDVEGALKQLSEIWQVSLDEATAQITGNLRALNSDPQEI
jgi:TatD DNase family protein